MGYVAHVRAFFVIPSYNDAIGLDRVLPQFQEHPHLNTVVVDDCSTDFTAKTLTKYPHIHHIRHPINLGQGAALKTGIEFALSRGADAIVTFDADGQHQLIDALSMLECLKQQHCDVVLGSRFLNSRNTVNMPNTRRLVLKLAVWFTKISTGLELSDTHNGLRALSKKAAQSINISQDRMAHASQILSEIARLKLKYVEHPVTIIYSEYSLQKGQKLSNSFNILWELFSEKFRG